MRARRVASWLVIVAGVVAVGWVISLVVTGHDNGALRISAVFPGAVGITLFRLFPRHADENRANSAVVAPELGATTPAPVDIVDR